MTIEEFINKTSRPLYNYRMARAQLHRKGMKQRMKKAEEEIRYVIHEFCYYEQTSK